MTEKGQISIHTENIFPIIKKFLYSDHEIFLRELVSNAVDATQKLKRLASLGEFSGEMGDLKVKVSFDKDAKTITISDAGIGMTAEEIKKYINQIAFSGATEFVEKYKGQAEDAAGAIIGHFGMGFYSSFMVAETVEIITKSYKEDDEASRWTCDGSTEFEITSTTRQQRGTDIILHVAADSEEFLDQFRLQSILDKYCRFLPIEIEFDGKVINNTQPIWAKSPSELTDEDYLKFYEELHPMAEKPLFWIHLNVDYPFNLTGILYFPKIKNELQLQREKIQLYSRQVFITDEVKDIVPEFLMLLHGVIDSPDIPLNVSRSFLQADANVKKINNYITRKVADKLNELFKQDRVAYEEKFENIGVFVKYGMISDDKFYEKAKDFVLFDSATNTEKRFSTIEEYKTAIAPLQTDKSDNLIVLYASDVVKQDAFVESAKKRGYDVVKADAVLDNHFINMLESKLEKVSFRRVDSDSMEKLIEKEVTLESILSETDQNLVKTLFEEVLSDSTKVIQLEALPADESPVALTQNEFMRRMSDMSKLGGQPWFGNMPTTHNLVVNTNHPAIAKLLAINEKEEQQKQAKQLYNLALLSQNMLTGKGLTAFIQSMVERLS
jgi:molecular chaperone HtpG